MKRINWSRHAVATFVEGTLCITRSTFCATGSVSPTIGLLLGETGGEIPPPPPFHLCPAHYSVSQSSTAQAENAGIVPTMVQSVAKDEGVGGGGGGGRGMKLGGGGTMYGLTSDSPTSVPRTCTQPVPTWLRFNQKTKQNTL